MKHLFTLRILFLCIFAALGMRVSAEIIEYQDDDLMYKLNTETQTAELECTFTLNLRNETDNYIYKLFKEWSMLGYDVRTGQRHLKKDYVADWLKVSIANRNGDIYKEVIFKDVMINEGVGGLGEYDYDQAEAQTITVKFVSDWWQDIDA